MIFLTTILFLNTSLTAQTNTWVGFKEILSYWESYKICVHFNNATSNAIAKLLPNQDIILINNDLELRYNVLHMDTRPSFHLILDSDIIMNHLRVRALHLLSTDIVFCVIIKQNFNAKKKICKIPFLYQAKGVFIHDITISSTWSCIYFANNDFAYIKKININKDYMKQMNYFTRSSKKFDRSKFKVGYMEMESIIYTR